MIDSPLLHHRLASCGTPGTSYRHRDKVKRPKVKAKQNSLPVFDLTNFEGTIFDNLIEFTIIKGSINPQLEYQNS